MCFPTMQVGEPRISFEFATAARIVFGSGTLGEVAPAVAGLGRRALVVTGRSVDRAAALMEQLESVKVAADTFPVSGEPTLDTIRAGVEKARVCASEVLIGFGGGSAIDASKAIAVLLTNPGSLLDYLEVIGRGKPLTHPPLPCVAVPTTAGTGAEVTRNAVLTAPDHRVKVSLRSPLMLPRLAVVDSALTLSLPPDLTASTGLDALTQLIEAFLCNRPNPITDALSREGMRRAAGALRRACRDGQDRQARHDMALASLLGGMVLANARLGAVHGLAGPLGGMFPAPHGMICARLLPVVMAANVRAIERRAPESPVLERFVEVARLLAGDAAATLPAGLAWLEALVEDLGVLPLSRFGLSDHDLPAVITQAKQASSMKGNPIALEEQELTTILRRAL